MVDDGSAKLAPAVKLLQVYGKEGDRTLLRDFYYQDDRWLDGALLSIEEAGETDVSALPDHSRHTLMRCVAETTRACCAVAGRRQGSRAGQGKDL